MRLGEGRRYSVAQENGVSSRTSTPLLLLPVESSLSTSPCQRGRGQITKKTLGSGERERERAQTDDSPPSTIRSTICISTCPPVESSEMRLWYDPSAAADWDPTTRMDADVGAGAGAGADRSKSSDRSKAILNLGRVLEVRWLWAGRGEGGKRPVCLVSLGVSGYGRTGGVGTPTDRLTLASFRLPRQSSSRPSLTSLPSKLLSWDPISFYGNNPSLQLCLELAVALLDFLVELGLRNNRVFSGVLQSS